MELTKTKGFGVLVIVVIVLSVMSVTIWVGVAFNKPPEVTNLTSQIDTLTQTLNAREKQIVLFKEIISNDKRIVKNYDEMIDILQSICVRQLKVIKAHGLEHELE